jgi:hypothetical protein
LISDAEPGLDIRARLWEIIAVLFCDISVFPIPAYINVEAFILRPNMTILIRSNDVFHFHARFTDESVQAHLADCHAETVRLRPPEYSLSH